jgi:hypothetical protein
VQRINNSDGAVLIIVALVIVILVGVTAFAIDFGVVFTTQKQLQNASDAGALAGARALGYVRCIEKNGEDECIPVSGVDPLGSETVAARSKAHGAVETNSAFATESLEIADNEIILGHWQNSTQEFTPVGESYTDEKGSHDVTEDNANAVQCIVRKEGNEGNKAIQAFFGRIFDQDGYDTRRESTAALSGLGKVGPGELLPIAISTGKDCNKNIIFTGSSVSTGGNSCVGWTDLTEDYKKSDVQDIIHDLSTAPAAYIGMKIEVNGGVTDSIKEFYDLWMTKPHPWEVLVPVYADHCANPDLSEPYPIVGFATLKITDVIPTGTDKAIYGTLVCDKVEEGRGGGADLGTLGTIPGLVQ